MLSERAMQILEKLIENNRTPITSKKLAMILGVSERSVKTYIKEVSDFCVENGMELEKKTGLGFVANFTEDQIEIIKELRRDNKVVLSARQRMSYIVYILLSGWDTYTLYLFSEELNVSRKVISDDIDHISKELQKYNIKINRRAGQGVFITGDEFSIRKAMKTSCTYAIGNKLVTEFHDYRINPEEEQLWINIYGQDNFEKVIKTIHFIENKYRVSYTDYSFKMLAQYLSIWMFRIRMGNLISQPILGEDELLALDEAVGDVADMLTDGGKIAINDYEREYLNVVLGSADVQAYDDRFKTVKGENIEEKAKKICGEMLDYLSEILNVNLRDKQLLVESLEAFIPASMVRTKYGIEAVNPFLGDVREMYSGIFATCFTLGKFYEEYTGKIPTDHEISFLALFVGGALHRNENSVKAVFMGTCGAAAANIVAGKVENKVEDVEIEAVLSSEELNKLDDYEYDIILSTAEGFKYQDKVVHISPVVTNSDVKKIRDKCFEVLSHPELKKEGFSDMIDINHIIFIKEKVSREKVLKEACRLLHDDGYVNGDFYEGVINRERIESTAIGNGVAIPHGLPETVCSPKVFVIRSKKPIDWENKPVNMVFLLALNFNNLNTTKAFFHDFARILGSEERVEKFRQAKTEAEMEAMLKEELHWA